MPGSGDEEGSEDEEVWGMLAGSAPDEEKEDSEDEEVWGMLAGSAPDEEKDQDASTSHPSAPSRPPSGCCGQQQATPCCRSEPEAKAPAAAEARELIGAVPRSAGAPAGGPGAAPWEESELATAVAERLPARFNFEIPRTARRLQRCGARHVGLQMPEGLQQWATDVADILRDFVPSVETTTIFGDVSYGACCIDDLGAKALGVDFLVHYGHSCLVPTDQTTVTTLYVHVEVQIDVQHLVETVKANFSADKRLTFMGTVQFTAGINQAVNELQEEHFTDPDACRVPQVKPLGVGEVLGCTSPKVEEGSSDAVVFVCDGRFHLESAMIQNPHVPMGFFRYDPFALSLTRESFAHDRMHQERRSVIQAARGAQSVGLILSTLGRQGSIGVLEEVERLLDKRGIRHVTVLLSELSPTRLSLFRGIGAWVQVACPRMSLDWGEAYASPLLTPYEAHVAFGDVAYKDVYPMDYYSNKGGPWSNYGARGGHGGSLGQKFRQSRRLHVEYDAA